MNLSFLFLMFAFLQVSAATFAQNVSIKVKEAGIDEVFYNLTQQTGRTFIADASLTQKLKPISLNMNNVSLNEVLIKCFEGEKLKIIFNEDDKIVIIKAEPDNKSLVNKSLSISGRIIDEKDIPMQGVSVKVKNTQIAATTDANGLYHITVLDQNAVLVYSFIGYASQEVTVGSKTVIDIALKPQNAGLNEVVVVGYGSVKRTDLTGAVGSVNMPDLQKAPVRSFDDALAGRVAGVVVSGNDGTPGMPNNIVIRGANSVTQDNSPLYVVDGFPLEDNSFFNSINNADIATIDVLKDASATAIYGARGSNGVIIITTKKGMNGAPKITYNGYEGLQTISKKMQMMDPYEFVKYQLEFSTSAAAPQYTPRDLPVTDPNYDPNGKTLNSYRDLPGVNWQNLVFRNAAMQNHDIALRGGNQNTQYSISGNILRQDGIYINSGFARNQGRVTLDQVVNSKLKVSANVNYSNTKSTGAPISSDASNGSLNTLFGVLAYRPISGDGFDLADALYDPEITADNLSVNPLLNAQNSYQSASSNLLIANAYAEYAFTKDLKLKVSGGITTNNITDELFYNSLTTRGNPKTATGVNGSINNIYSATWLNENTLTYDKAINSSHHINLLAGFTSQGNGTKVNGLSATLIPNEALGIDGLDESPSQIGNSSSDRWTLSSFLARVNYSYKSTLILTASFRADGSSRFAAGKQWAYFPAGAIAWRMGEENFMKNVPSVSSAKLRMSYGLTGNNRIAEFSYLSQLNIDQTNAYSYNNGTPSLGLGLSVLGNPDLKWETTSMIDVGYDLGLFKERVLFTVDLYRKTTYDLLLNAQLPYTTGLTQAFKNIGKMNNQGLEFTLNTVNVVSKNFKWQSNFNISFNRNKLLGLTENQSSLLSGARFDNTYNALFPYIAIVGEPVSQMYGLIWDGNYQYSDFQKTPDGKYLLKPNVPTNGNATVQPGDIKYKDINGDGVIDAKDYAIIGRTQPIHTGGFSNTFNYKGFDLNVFLQWSYGNDIINANRYLFEGNARQNANINQFASYENRWSPTNQTNDNFRVGGQGPAAFSSRVVEDGSYLRLKTVSLGYTIPQNLLKRIKITNLRFYASAQNLYTLTGYTGYDPEVSVRNSTLTPGFDYAPYPRARVITFGINLTL